MSTWGWVCIGALVGVVLNLQWRIADVERTLLQQVQMGEVILRCDMPDATRNIDGALVVDYHDGQWTFTNGFSSTCVLVTP